jgi:hypothetical protein
MFHQFLPLAPRIGLRPGGKTDLTQAAGSILDQRLDRDLWVEDVQINLGPAIDHRLLLSQCRLIMN